MKVNDKDVYKEIQENGINGSKAVIDNLFYDKLVEGSDNDGIEDFLIEDAYFTGQNYIEVAVIEGDADSEEAMREEIEDRVNRYALAIHAAYHSFLYDHPEVFWLEGKWYAVDVTWNDPMISNDGSEGLCSGWENRDWLLFGSDTVIGSLSFIDSHQERYISSAMSSERAPTLSTYAYQTMTETKIENISVESQKVWTSDFKQAEQIKINFFLNTGEEDVDIYDTDAIALYFGDAKVLHTIGKALSLRWQQKQTSKENKLAGFGYSGMNVVQTERNGYAIYFNYSCDFWLKIWEF